MAAASSSSQVKDFEEDLAGIAETVRRDIAALRATFPDPTKPAAPDAKPITNRGDRVASIFEQIRRFRLTLSQLEIEAAEVPAGAQTELRARIKGYKSTLAALEKERDTVKKQSADADHDDLTRNTLSSNQKAVNAAGAIGAPGDDPETLRRKRELASNTVKMKEGNEILAQAERTLVVIHDTADDTLTNLDDQGKKIRGIASTTQEMDQELTIVARTLRKMQKELLKNKLMLAAVIVILVIAIVGLLYYKFGGAGGTSVTSVTPTGDDTLPPTAPPGVSATPAPFFIPTLPPSRS